MRPTGLSKAFLKLKNLISFRDFMGMDDPFADGETARINDPYPKYPGDKVTGNEKKELK
jgi:hypothetical protein